MTPSVPPNNIPAGQLGEPDRTAAAEVIGFSPPLSSTQDEAGVTSTPPPQVAGPVVAESQPASGVEFTVAQADRLDGIAQRFHSLGVVLYCIAPSGEVLWHDELTRPDLRRAGVCGQLSAGGVAHIGPACYIARFVNEYGGGRLFVAAATGGADSSAFLSPPQVEAVATLVGQALADAEQSEALRGEVESLSGQLAHTYEELSLIYQLSGGMRVNRDVDDFFASACAELTEVLNVQSVGYALAPAGVAMGQASGTDIGLALPGSGNAGMPGVIAPIAASGRIRAVMAGQVQLPPGRLNRLAEELTELLVGRGQPLICNDIRNDPALSWSGDHVHELLAVPIQRQDQLLGVMFAVNRPAGQFTWGEAKLMSSIAAQASAYLENSLLYQDLQSLLMGLLHALTSAVDAKDEYTCGHSQRVALISHALALRAGLTPALAQRVYISGLLHDVGKIGVSEAVLRKPGRLDEAEFAEMRRHPIIGAKILRQIPQVQDILPGVLYHHERFDGNGYPHRLAGKDIPLFGRIICVADCIDAMTSDRVYRPGMAVDIALSEIIRNAGTQFDPEIAAAAQAMGVQGLAEILARHRETPDQYHNAGLQGLPGSASPREGGAERAA